MKQTTFTVPIKTKEKPKIEKIELKNPKYQQKEIILLPPSPTTRYVRIFLNIKNNYFILFEG